MINSIFANNTAEAKHYYKIIVKNLLRPLDEDKVMPLYYSVPEELMEEERKHPGSQERMPSPEIAEGSTHLWTQSIWFIARLLSNQFILLFGYFLIVTLNSSGQVVDYSRARPNSSFSSAF